MLKKLLFSLCILCFNYSSASAENAASKATIENNKKVTRYLPFANKDDYNDAKKGFEATAKERKIRTEKDMLFIILTNLTSYKEKLLIQ